MGKTQQEIWLEEVIMADIIITIERTPTQAAIYSDEPGITVIRDAHVTDRELLLTYADVLEAHRNSEEPLQV
jgi:hypothetical protein